MKTHQYAALYLLLAVSFGLMLCGVRSADVAGLVTFGFGALMSLITLGHTPCEVTVKVKSH